LKLRSLIVEDEPLARNLLVEYVKKVSTLELIQTSSNPLQAIEVLRTQPVDLMFLDIQMPEITGISLLKTLQKKPLVILTTAYSEYALESYELDVVDYLLKPVTFDRFLRAVDKASHRFSAPPSTEKAATAPRQSFVFVKDGTRLIKINFDDILYVEGLKDYVTIVTRTGKIVSLQRLKTLETQLPAETFIRVHHSYIISMKAIDSIHKGEVRIGNNAIPISDSYKKALKEFIERNQMQ
jgi:two-component system LytT family response regulator